MDFEEYQSKAHSTAIYPKIIVLKNPENIAMLEAYHIGYEDISWVYPLVSLAGEIGETANKMKKIIRDDGFKISNEKLEEIKKEIGDCQWYNAELCTSLRISLDTVAVNNIEKLESRKQREKVKGEGDNR